MLGRVATADVVVAPFGIGPEDKEIVARPLAFVARAGRQDRDVAGGERKHLALLAAETDALYELTRLRRELLDALSASFQRGR